MIDWMHMAETLIASPWFYGVLIAVSLLDSFLPLIPSEPVIVVAGVYAASGDTHLLACIAATALGAFLGDLIPYLLGRLVAERIRARLRPGTKRRRAHDWIAGSLAARGGYVLMTSRFIPFGRYLVTVSAGMVGYPWRRYVCFAAVAGLCWSTYTVLIGYVGGALFQENDLVAVGVGLGLAFLLSGVIEAVRYVRRRRSARHNPAGEHGHAVGPDLAGKADLAGEADFAAGPDLAALPAPRGRGF
ncbi:DedA family protein [Streptomyces zagrosensis]|uniref:Membrane protein DedA with SNARE-associated domain n=1 Tax=Streptomyces zagrosensis TaxID=1042984 RepID=A0A7W9UYN7_9ACTN|nr:DedA family protein [Streptomyces zagrosensis]MBB5936150.1 membrane protein DedA with SNARE-associated domain [Streptomyces zagrosensis]